MPLHSLIREFTLKRLLVLLVTVVARSRNVLVTRKDAPFRMKVQDLWNPSVEVFFHAGVFLSLNVLVNYVSKLYFAGRDQSTVFGPGLGYSFPIFDSVVDNGVGSVLCLLLMGIFPSLRQVSVQQFWDYKITLILVMIFHVTSIVLNNLSLVQPAPPPPCILAHIHLVSVLSVCLQQGHCKYRPSTLAAAQEWLGLSINQIIKGLAPLPTMIFSFFVLKTRYPILVIASVVCLSAGQTSPRLTQPARGWSPLPTINPLQIQTKPLSQ